MSEGRRGIEVSGPAFSRLPFVGIGMVALLTGAYAGALRLGWGDALPHPGFLVDHGALMAGGFLGTLIGVERAVALARPWAYAGPALTAFAALAMLAGLPEQAPRAAMLGGSLSLVVVSAWISLRQRTLFNGTMAAGAVAWAIGNAVWFANRPPFDWAPWWAAFLILTIAGERLELSRFVRRGPEAQWLFATVLIALAAGLALGPLTSGPGARLTGVALLGLALWLARYDVARRTVRQTGLPRFTAVCLLSGYAWLGLAGATLVAGGGASSGGRYDAVLHAVFLGFVMAMVFGHAPIIFPAVLRVAVPYRTAFYAHWALLQVSLALRIGGDLTERWPVREWGGLLNALTLLLFLANTAISVRRGAAAAVGGVTPRRKEIEA
jgi:hypothetical protein